MDKEDKKLYARESKKLQHQREREREAEQDLARATERKKDLEEYETRNLQESIPSSSLQQEHEVAAEADRLTDKIMQEVGKDPHVDRIDGETVRAVAALNLGFARGYVIPNAAGLFCAGRFVDLTMADIIAAVHNPPPGAIPRYDRPWNTSPAFLAAYRVALKASLDICAKYPQLVEKNYVSIINNEWTRVCETGS
jgi:hypothetical protein